MKKVLLKSVLLIMPILFLIIGLNFNRTWFSGDPEYAYLLNGVNIATFHSVGHTDNPGTPVQMYSAVVLRIAHFFKFSETSDLQTDVLRNPDQYVELERKVSVILNSLMILFLGFGTFFLFRNLWFCLILQATSFLSSNLLEHAFTKVSPEPVLFFTVMLLVLLILKFYLEVDKTKKIYPWLFACIVGFGVATKATFIPLAVLPFLLLEGKKSKILYLAGCIPAFILFTAPAIPDYPHMAKWFLGLSTHTGTYGHGETGIIDPARYIYDLRAIFANNITLFISLVLGTILITFSFVSIRIHGIHSPLSLKFMSSILFVQILGIFMVAKHYHANHYLIPVISLIGILWIFGLLLIKELFLKSKKTTGYIMPAVLIMFLLPGFTNANYLMAAYHGYSITNEEYSMINKRLDHEFPGYIKTYYYPTSINPYSALRWGNIYAHQLYNDQLCEIYPEGIFYNNQSNSFQLWEADIPTDDLVRDYGSKILLIGGPMSDDERKSVEMGGLALKEIYHGRSQVIYEVDTAKSLLFMGINTIPLWSISCGGETISKDGKWFLTGAFKFENNSNQSNEVVRSGKYSIKLPSYNTFAMGILLDSIHPGQHYKVSAWRKGGKGNAFLVATSEKQGEFYLQNCEYYKTDEKSWNKVTLDFSIPSTYSTNKLKVYLWNNGNEAVYFDDFTITRLM